MRNESKTVRIPDCHMIETAGKNNGIVVYFHRVFYRNLPIPVSDLLIWVNSDGAGDGPLFENPVYAGNDG